MATSTSVPEPDLRISYGECITMFGDCMPVEAVTLLLSPDPKLDTAQHRALLTEMAAKWAAATPEQKARRANPVLEIAMTAYWDALAKEGAEPWHVVQAAIDTVLAGFRG